MRAAAFFFGLLLLATSCRQPKELVYEGIDKVTVNQSVISVNVRMYNPNHYKLKMKNADLSVLLNGAVIGKMEAADNLEIARQDTFTLPVALHVELAKSLPNAMQLLFNSEVNIQLTGNVKAGRHGVFVNVPVNYEGKYDLKNLINQ